MSPEPSIDWPGLLDVVHHRPWPVPSGSWLMTMSWCELLFAHWPVDKKRLRELVPPDLAIDTFDGEAWVSIVPFEMRNTGPRGFDSLPWVSRFAELNLRTYVVHDGKPGVFFFSLDAANPLAVRAARFGFHLPYFDAQFSMTVDSKEGHRSIDYRCERNRSFHGARFAARYGPKGPVLQTELGTLDHFLTERYALYAVDPWGGLHRGEVHHPPWPVQRAWCDVGENTLTDWLDLPLPDTGPILHFAEVIDVLAWMPERL